ncbi:MAG: histidine kinase N-terminal 7TM domain-containing protein [Chloroflexota bacterium]|nr:histidine kinase N-terminal 7TM domain-containing protein [Chloroflexota bacterium]
MITSGFPSWAEILIFANLLLSSAVAILAFSLLAYILAYNIRTRVGKAVAALLACVLVVYTGDVLLALVLSEQSDIWLRIQWLGIAFVPAAYFDLSDALLRTTNAVSKRRTRLVAISYLFSAAISVLALFSDLVVRPGTSESSLQYLEPGPLFPLFVFYFVATALYGLTNTYRARQRCLTAASRRRMSYLMVSFVAPGLGVFPYLILVGLSTDPSRGFVLVLTLIGNIAVAAMLVLMTYSVAYYGVLSPDRVVKRNLLIYLIRGPLLGILIVGAMLTIPRVERILGLPRDTVLLLTVVAMVVLLQLVIELLKPAVERLIYSEDQGELMAIRELDRRLLTSSDLRQFLENVLVALCEYLRVPGGFVAVQAGDELLVEATCGPSNLAYLIREHKDWQSVLSQSAYSNGQTAIQAPWIRYNGYWLWPLRTRGRENMLGLVGLMARPGEDGPSAGEREIVSELMGRAEVALEDRLLQQGVFLAVEEILPGIEQVQRWRSVVPYVGTPPLKQPAETEAIIYEPEYNKWVKDALSHYWGGPKLTESPLMELQVVGKAAEIEGGNPTKGLRAVLTTAIEDLKPAGQRQMTASEWLLYNILDLKFIQGKRVREIANRLAMSESDLYRKQRVAVEQVALQIAEMEASNSQLQRGQQGVGQNNLVAGSGDREAQEAGAREPVQG